MKRNSVGMATLPSSLKSFLPNEGVPLAVTVVTCIRACPVLDEAIVPLGLSV